MVERKRPRFSITLSKEALAEVEEVAERNGENRSRAVERLVEQALKVYRLVGKYKSNVPQLLEVYQRVYVDEHGSHLGAAGVRPARDVSWEELPEFFKQLIPPGAVISEFSGGEAELEELLVGAEADVAELKRLLADAKEGE